MKLSTQFVATALALPTAMGLSATPTSSIKVSSSLSMASTGMDEDYTNTAAPSQMGKKKSESIPFLGCSKVLQESDLAGNVGFDPLGLAKNKEQLWEYREAEIKHARLAMLAAVGWPVSEVMDRNIAEFFNAQSVLDEGDRVPSVLNGGMGKIAPQWWGFCLGLCAAIDMYGAAKARRGDPDYFPGNLSFDPMGLYPADKEGQEKRKLAEMKHGRVAMMGVLGYVIEEAKTHIAVVDETPILFQPFTETVEEGLEAVVSAEEALVGVIGTEEGIAQGVAALGAL
jgi:hypothetical protein